MPIALMTLALSLEKLTNLSPPVCFAIAFGVGLLVAAILVIPALATLKTGVRMFDRSLSEWRAQSAMGQRDAQTHGPIRLLRSSCLVHPPNIGEYK